MEAIREGAPAIITSDNDSFPHIGTRLFVWPFGEADSRHEIGKDQAISQRAELIQTIGPNIKVK
jgi:hypothetical protein